MVIDPAALHLRFRDDATPVDPDVDAFLPASTPAGAVDEFGVLPGREPVDPDGPIVVFLQHPEFGIPAPYHDAGLPDLGGWCVRPTKFGWIATVSPPARPAGPRRVARMIAGCLALTLPIPAVAAPATSSKTPAPAAAPATPASPPASASSSKTPTPAAAPATPAPATPAPASPEPTTTPAPAAFEPTPVSPPPPPPRGDQALTDAAWEGIDGFVVQLVLKGGKELRGRVGAVQADTFTLIESTEGQILVIPKSGVASLRAYVPPPLPSQTGIGLIAGGSVLVAMGVPVFITGIAFVAICPSCVYLHLPMLVVGGGGLGGGIPMISRGIQRRTAFQRAVEEHRIVPVVQRTQFHGWTGGLQFRF